MNFSVLLTNDTLNCLIPASGVRVSVNAVALGSGDFAALGQSNTSILPYLDLRHYSIYCKNVHR
jgi:hypothetical protein